MGRMFYVDESADAHHHFHGGVLIDAGAIPAATGVLDEARAMAAKAGYQPWTSSVELHAKAIMGGEGAWAQVTIDDKLDLIAHALSALAVDGVEVIVRGIHLARWRQKYGALPVDDYGFKNLAERLNERMHELDDHAVMIADESRRAAAQRFELDWGQRLGTTGYRHQKLDRIVDTVHFVDSTRSPMVQLADLVTYVKRRGRAPRHRDPRAAAALDRLVAIVDAAIPRSTYDQVYFAQVPTVRPAGNPPAT